MPRKPKATRPKAKTGAAKTAKWGAAAPAIATTFEMAVSDMMSLTPKVLMA